jgi:DNA-binding transcriptional MerR regulator
MKQVMELTGLSRQVIHFYVRKGLVPPPLKHGRTSAEYTDEHVERILAVRRMRDEQFLPLDVIRAALDQRDEGYTPAQRRVIASVRGRLGGGAKRSQGRRATLAVTTAARRTGVPVGEIHELADLGLLTLSDDVRGRPRIDRADLWLVEIWGELRANQLGTDDGFPPEHLLIYQRAVDELVRQEVVLLTEVLGQLDPGELAARVERGLPIIAALLGQMHDRAVRRLLAAADDPASAG